MRPVVIAVAITGSVPQKADNPAVPITVDEQIESTIMSCNEGASLVHVHVRDDEGKPSSDPDKFLAFKNGIEAACPGIIVQFSTGGRGRTPEMRGSSLIHRPDMASLSTGSVNFPTIVYENPTTLVEQLAVAMQANCIKPEIEIFDMSHLHSARRLADMGLIDDSPHIQFVMGIKNAMPAIERLLDAMLDESRILFPQATWTAAGIGRYQQPVMLWALERGADAIRTGMEDNIRRSHSELAAGNWELVRMATRAIAKRNARPASFTEARRILGLRPLDAGSSDFRQATLKESLQTHR